MSDTALELLTVPELATLWRMSPKSIRRRITAGELPVVYIGRAIRIRRTDAEQLINPSAQGRRARESRRAAAAYQRVAGLLGVIPADDEPEAAATPPPPRQARRATARAEAPAAPTGPRLVEGVAR